MADNTRSPEFAEADRLVAAELARHVPLKALADIGYEVGRLVANADDTEPDLVLVVSDEDDKEKERQIKQSKARHPSSEPQVMAPKNTKKQKRRRPDLREISFSDPVWPEPESDEVVEEQVPSSDYIAAQLADAEQRQAILRHAPEVRKVLAAIPRRDYNRTKE